MNNRAVLVVAAGVVGFVAGVTLAVLTAPDQDVTPLGHDDAPAYDWRHGPPSPGP